MSRAIRRFFYVHSAGRTLLHMMFGTTHTEGLTACGRVVSKGWKWITRIPASRVVCKQCLARADDTD
jgi:hypothetical protein